METLRLIVSVAVLCAAQGAPDPGSAQVPLGIATARGQTVTPVYEGWYPNSDGSYSLSFGYFNRNFDEVIEVPAGANNHIVPTALDGLQPTQFHPRRHWGVFTVTIPSGFDDQAIVWTLAFRGERYSIPGRLHPDWQIDALAGEVGSGNTPPVLAFSEDGPEGVGPGGVTSESESVGVGVPLALAVWAKDDGRASGSVARTGSAGVPVTLTWFKHSGPGAVFFSEATAKVLAEGGKMTLTATFAEPGAYVLRVRANDASGVAGAGHAQCCWTNGFVKVQITR